MSRQTRIILAVVGGALILCLAVVIVGALVLRRATQALEQAVVTDPTQVAAVAEKVAAFTPPPGYEVGAMELFGFEMIFVQPAEGEQGVVFALMQFPETGQDRARIEEQMQRGLERQLNQGTLNLEEVGQRQAVIAGQEVSLTVREGTDAEGRAIRQLSGALQGKAGPVLFTATGPQARWDEALVEDFLGSIETR